MSDLKSSLDQLNQAQNKLRRWMPWIASGSMLITGYLIGEAVERYDRALEAPAYATMQKQFTDRHEMLDRELTSCRRSQAALQAHAK